MCGHQMSQMSQSHGLPRKQLSVKRWSLVILRQDVLFMMTIELYEISDINIERKNYQKQLH